MNKEDKELLLKDLCARLPYGVQINHQGYIQELTVIVLEDIIYSEHEVKPYLRPMSSMTKEEKFDIGRLLVDYGEGLPTDMYIDEVIDNSIVIDYLLEHHFDYRSLIEKGLALPAPPDMYKID